MEHNEKRAVVIILRKLGNIDKMFCPAVAMQQNIKFGAGFLLYPSTGNVDGTCTKCVMQLETQFVINISMSSQFNVFSTPTV